jgi:hypothetical protein
MQSEWFHWNDCTILRESEKAFEIEDADGNRCWIPKSQLHPDHLRDPDPAQRTFADLPSCCLRERDTGVTVTCTEWIAKQKGLV